MAAENGHLDMLRLLLDRGASVQARHGDGASPLLKAIRSGHEEAAIVLLKNGADPAAVYVRLLCFLHMSLSFLLAC
jgi:ankyrin repeat protein